MYIHIRLNFQMCEDLKDADKDEMKQVIAETKQLLNECSTKYNSSKAR